MRIACSLGAVLYVVPLALANPGAMQAPRPITTPRGCTFASPPAGVTFSFTFTRKGAGVSDDGRGPYVHGKEGVRSNLANAGARVYPYVPSDAQPERTMSVDLSHPVDPRTQTNHGVVVRSDTNFRVHWKQDEASKIISGILDIPVGATVQSDRVEVSVMLNGRQHVLRFGNLDTAVCWDAVRVTGADTTLATVSRTSETEWHVNLPIGSRGRLWDLNDQPTETTALFRIPTDTKAGAGGASPPNATDRGLYVADTEVTIRRQ